MGNKGYRAEANFEAIMQNLFTSEEPLRYSEVWRRCRERGMGSKETLSKYLKRFEKTGILIHDERGYRRNPLINYPRLNELGRSLRRSLPRSRKGWQYSYYTPPGPPSMSEGDLLANVRQEFNMAFRVYAWMLSKLVQTNDAAAAQELVGIFMRTQINPILDDLAMKIWLARKTVPIEALKTRRLSWSTEK